MKRLSTLDAFVSLRAILVAGLLCLTSLGDTGCGAFGLTYSLTGLYVEPQANLTCVAPGMTAQFKAYGSYTEGGHATKVEDISNQVNWSVSLPQLATMNATGLATAATRYIGTTPILATIQGEFGELKSDTSLQVSTTCVSAAVVIAPFRLHIVPASQKLSVGASLQPLAVDARGLDLSGQATWSSSDPTVAVVDARGVIHAIGAGDATVTAVAPTPSGASASAAEAVHVSGNSDAL